MFKILLLQCVEEKCMFDFPLEICLTSRSEYLPILIFFRFNQTNQKKKQIPSLHPFLMTFKDRLFLSNKGYYPCQKNQNIYMLTPKQNLSHTHTHIRHSLLPSLRARGQLWLIIKERETLQSPECGREDGEMRERDTCGWEKRLSGN